MGPFDISYFGETDFRNRQTKFGIKQQDRLRHMYVIGKTGMGKSTLLENIAVQDIQNGNGMCFLDPHGQTAELLLDYVPEERIDDVMYFAPFDLQYPLSFNVLEDVGPERRHLVASGLMSAFKKIWVDAWSARMEYLLNNAMLALIEYPNSTLLSINRMFADKVYRKNVVSNVSDVSVKAFWVNEFESYNERYAQEATAAIQNKVGQFTSNPLIRNIVGQTSSSFDFRNVMDTNKIVIANFSKGQLGEDNANLLGSMLITKLYLAAMSRADLPLHLTEKLPPFYFFVDEFQSFANESFANILSEARKYKLALTVAHQYVEQMTEEIAASVFGNVGTMITFRVGARDAEVFEKEYFPQFTKEDLVNLGPRQIYLRLMIDGAGSKPFSANTLPPIPEAAQSYRDIIIERSRSQFAAPQAEVEHMLRGWHVSPLGRVHPDGSPLLPDHLAPQLAPIGLSATAQATQATPVIATPPPLATAQSRDTLTQSTSGASDSFSSVRTSDESIFSDTTESHHHFSDTSRVIENQSFSDTQSIKEASTESEVIKLSPENSTLAQGVDEYGLDMSAYMADVVNPKKKRKRKRKRKNNQSSEEITAQQGEGRQPLETLSPDEADILYGESDQQQSNLRENEKKVGSQEHLADLKSALASLQQSRTDVPSQPASSDQASGTDQEPTSSQPSEEILPEEPLVFKHDTFKELDTHTSIPEVHRKTPSFSGEIPEDLLRSLLTVSSSTGE